ncbi:MAG: hypothetical protein QOJ96_441 [Alphaproteobacteria bacterium]|nr:hypothetical protein [Alphaproteobacteria bacterium]
MNLRLKAARAALLLLVLVAGSAVPAFADLKDYDFQLVQSEVKQANGAVVDVRLVNTKLQAPVADAVIFAQRIDMAPDGMEMMAAPIELMPSPSPGVYRFKTDLTMAGRWQLSISAKVQGETGTLEKKLILTAVR